MSEAQPISRLERRTRQRRFRLIALALLIVVMAGGSLWLNLRTYHLATVQQGILYRCGNRGMSEFAHAMGHTQARTVITLIDDTELNSIDKPQFREEARYLHGLNIKQERIPVQLGGWPSSEQIARFLSIVSDPANQPVLIHCSQGVRRTGMFVAAYQESVLGYNQAKAKDAIETFGHSDRTAEDIRKFIDDYDPANRTVATTRPATGNE